MNLRNDLSKQEKEESLKICKDIIENFREDLQVLSSGNKG